VQFAADGRVFDGAYHEYVQYTKSGCRLLRGVPLICHQSFIAYILYVCLLLVMLTVSYSVRLSAE